MVVNHPIQTFEAESDTTFLTVTDDEDGVCVEEGGGDAVADRGLI